MRTAVCVPRYALKYLVAGDRTLGGEFLAVGMWPSSPSFLPVLLAVCVSAACGIFISGLGLVVGVALSFFGLWPRARVPLMSVPKA